MDNWVFDVVVGHRLGWLNSLATGLLDLATNVVVLALCAAVCVAVVLVFHAFRVAGAVALAVVVAAISAGVLKHLIERVRPPADQALVDAVGWSMPSTDAAITAAAAMALIVTVSWRSPRRRLTAVLLLSAGTAIVGACLVYLGVHWTTDVLAGWVVGVAVGFSSGRILRPNVGSIVEIHKHRTQ